MSEYTSLSLPSSYHIVRGSVSQNSYSNVNTTPYRSKSSEAYARFENEEYGGKFKRENSSKLRRYEPFNRRKKEEFDSHTSNGSTYKSEKIDNTKLRQYNNENYFKKLNIQICRLEHILDYKIFSSEWADVCEVYLKNGSIINGSTLLNKARSKFLYADKAPAHLKYFIIKCENKIDLLLNKVKGDLEKVQSNQESIMKIARACSFFGNNRKNKCMTDTLLLIAKIAQEKIELFIPPNLTGLTAAFVNANLSVPNFFSAIVPHMKNTINKWSSKDLSDIAASFDRAEIGDQNFLITIRKERLKKSSGSQVDLRGAMETAFNGDPNIPLCRDIARSVIDNLEEIPLKELSRVMERFANSGIRDKEGEGIDGIFFSIIAKKTIKEVNNFAWIDLAQIVRSFSLLCYDFDNDELFATVHKRLLEERISSTSLMLLAWSFSIIYSAKEGPIGDIFRLLEDQILDVNPIHAQQLYQACLASKINLDHYPKINAFIKKNKRIFEKNHFRVSAFQNSVVLELENLHVSIAEKELYVDGYRIDIVLDKSKKIALDPQGPSHFLNPDGNPVGKELLRHQILKNSGWIIEPISYLKWHKMNPNERNTFLLELINSLNKQAEERDRRSFSQIEEA